MRVKMKYALVSWIFFLFLSLRGLAANEILVNTQDGEVFILDVDPLESLKGIQDQIAAVTNGKNSHALVDFTGSDDVKDFSFKDVRCQGQYLGYPRNYFAEVSDEEKEISALLLKPCLKSLIFQSL